MNALTIRTAGDNDVNIIVRFNQELALETENKVLDTEIVARGVRAVLNDPSRGSYFLAEQSGTVIGQVMHTREWSDWRNGDIWWLQSVYVERPFRGRGVFRALFSHLRDLAQSTEGVVGLRLYVEHQNHVAQAVYRNLGMNDGGYRVMELLD